MVMVILPCHHAEHLPSLPVALEERLFAVTYFCLIGRKDCRLNPLHFDAAPLYHACSVRVKSMFSAQQLRQVFRRKISIALQHLPCLVAGDSGHLHGVKPFDNQLFLFCWGTWI